MVDDIKIKRNVSFFPFTPLSIFYYSPLSILSFLLKTLGVEFKAFYSCEIKDLILHFIIFFSIYYIL